MNAMPTLYIAGKITGEPNYTEQFNGAEALLRAVGYGTENPVVNDAKLRDAQRPTEDVPYTAYLRAGLDQLLRCQGVAVLDGWWSSQGARWEVQTAGILGIPVRPVQEWLNMANDPDAPSETKLTAYPLVVPELAPSPFVKPAADAAALTALSKLRAACDDAYSAAPRREGWDGVPWVAFLETVQNELTLLVGAYNKQDAIREARECVARGAGGELAANTQLVVAHVEHREDAEAIPKHRRHPHIKNRAAYLADTGRPSGHAVDCALVIGEQVGPCDCGADAVYGADDVVRLMRVQDADARAFAAVVDPTPAAERELLGENAKLTANLHALGAERNELRVQLDMLRADQERLLADRKLMDAQLDDYRSRLSQEELDNAREQWRLADAERNALRTQLGDVDTVCAELRGQLDAANAKLARMQERLAISRAHRDRLRADRDNLRAERKPLEADLQRAVESRLETLAERARARRQRDEADEKLAALRGYLQAGKDGERPVFLTDLYKLAGI